MVNRPKKKNKKADGSFNKEQHDKLQAASYAIQRILESHNLALQPYLGYTEYGIKPLIRLVELPNHKDNEQQTTEGKAPEDKGTDTPTQSK